jgi:hypothetical protein
MITPSPVTADQYAPPFQMPGSLRPTVQDSAAATKHQNWEGVTFKIADCREDREAAHRLLYDRHVTRGLMVPNPYGMRVTPYHLLPTTDVFVALHDGNVVYTMTVISDDFSGFPIESLYEHEVGELRSQGPYLAEVTCLASRHDYFDTTRMFDVFVRLMGLVLQYAQNQDIDRLVIAVHPRHFRMYHRLLGFEQIGAQRNYPSALNQPAVAAQHDFTRFQRDQHPMHGRVYADSYRRWELLRQPMLEQDREYFHPVADLCGSAAMVVGT